MMTGLQLPVFVFDTECKWVTFFLYIKKCGRSTTNYFLLIVLGWLVFVASYISFPEFNQLDQLDILRPIIYNGT